MHHDDAAGAITMRVRILLSRTPVRRPAGVAHSVGSVERLVTQYVFEIAKFAFSPLNLQYVILIDDGDAG